MTHGSLFSGIGGFDLAAEWMGWENKFHCEWNPFGQKVLKYYFPEAESFNDITQSNFEKYAGSIDIISGGFPCQPYSSAGKRLGKDDPRHLWPEMLRVISEVRPRWVVGENVRGLTNWNGGMVFDEVQSDLEAIGFEVLPFLLPAAAVNAPHRRDRIWFIAHANGDGYGTDKHGSLRQKNGTNEGEGIQTFHNAIGSNGNQGTSTNTDGIRLEQRQNRTEVDRGQKEMVGQGGEFTYAIKTNGQIKVAPNTNSNGLHECDRVNEINASEGRFNAQCNIEQGLVNGNFANTNNKGLQRIENSRSIRESRQESNQFIAGCVRTNWKEFPTKSPVCYGDDGLSDRLDGITFPKWRKESIKAGGNAIVPQVAYQIFKTIQQYRNL